MRLTRHGTCDVYFAIIRVALLKYLVLLQLSANTPWNVDSGIHLIPGENYGRSVLRWESHLVQVCKA